MPSACPCTVMYPAHQDHRIQPYSAYHSNIRTSIFPVSPFMTRYAQCTSAASQTSNRTQSYGFLGRSNTTNDITRIKYFIYLKPHLFKISRPVTNCFFFFFPFLDPTTPERLGTDGCAYSMCASCCACFLLVCSARVGARVK